MQRNYGNEKPPPFSYPDPSWVQEQGCVLFMPFGMQGGNKAYDLSGNNNHGTLTGMANPPTATSGWNPRGLSFDGVNDYVSVANESNFDFERISPFSISGWFKPSSAVMNVPVSKFNTGSPYNGWQLLFNTGNDVEDAGKVTLFLNANYPGSTISVYSTNDTRLNDGNWHYYTFTYTGSSNASGVSIYEDGVLLPMTTKYNTLTTSILHNAPVYIGKRNGTDYPYAGLIDDVRIYNRALSADEIAHQYAEPYYMIPRPLSNTPQSPNWIINKDIILSSLSLEYDAKSYMLSALTLENIYKDYLKSSFNLEEIATAYIRGSLSYEQAITSFIQASFNLEVIAKDYMKSSLNVSPDQLMRMVVQTIKRKDGISTIIRDRDVSIISRKRNITIEGK